MPPKGQHFGLCHKLCTQMGPPVLIGISALFWGVDLQKQGSFGFQVDLDLVVLNREAPGTLASSHLAPTEDEPMER